MTAATLTPGGGGRYNLAMKDRLPLRTLVVGSAAAAFALLAGLTLFSALEARRHFEDVLWV